MWHKLLDRFMWMLGYVPLTMTGIGNGRSAAGWVKITNPGEPLIVEAEDNGEEDFINLMVTEPPFAPHRDDLQA